MSSYQNELFDRFFDARLEIKSHFGHIEDWRIFQFEDLRRSHWMLVGGEDGQLVYSSEPFTEKSLEEGKVVYSASIYTYRHLEKWVHRQGDVVLVLGDTRCDGNILHHVLSAPLEVTDEKLKEVWKLCWG